MHFSTECIGLYIEKDVLVPSMKQSITHTQGYSDAIPIDRLHISRKKRKNMQSVPGVGCDQSIPAGYSTSLEPMHTRFRQSALNPNTHTNTTGVADVLIGASGHEVKPEIIKVIK